MNRYTISRVLGGGAFGQVSAGLRIADGHKVALKRVFKDTRARDGVDVSALRELVAHEEIRTHANICGIIDAFFDKRGEITLVYDMMVGSIGDLLKEQSIVFTEAAIKAYMSQLLKGLSFMHSKFIVHRDIKPDNLLISFEGVLKIGDFGSARTYGTRSTLSPQAVTIWYRPPELSLGSSHYSSAVDMWSTGCVMAQLYLRRPIFVGNSDLGMLANIFDVRGTPSPETWPSAKSLHSSYTPKPPKPIQSIILNASTEALALMDDLLKLDPNLRPSAELALTQSYFMAQPRPMPIRSLPTLPSWEMVFQNTEDDDEEDKGLVAAQLKRLDDLF